MEHDEGGKPADELPDGSQTDSSTPYQSGEDTEAGGPPAEPATQNPQE